MKRREKKAQPIKKVERKHAQGTAEELALWREVCEFNCVYLNYELEREQERHQQICERLKALNGEDELQAVDAAAENLPYVADPAEADSERDMFSDGLE